MTNKEILEKSITKAIEGGWRDEWFLNRLNDYEWNDKENGWFDWEHHVLATDFIFDHDFAKALWGSKREHMKAITVNGKGSYSKPAWKYHLQQMVIAEDQIRYLGENI